MVSIHAPAWGATHNIPLVLWDRCSFNPRSRMGSDLSIYAYQEQQNTFQSTLPHGERHDQVMVKRRFFVSIHAPAWGATRDLQITHWARRVSIHAPAWGATKHPFKLQRLLKFQSTLPHGERQEHPGSRGDWNCFNPRSRMGSDC